MRKPEPPAPTPGGRLGEALKNLQRCVDQESFGNPRGNTQEFGPAISSTPRASKFGPWIRRFVAQVKSTGRFRPVCGHVAARALSSSRSTCTATGRSPT
ncbi:MAG: hypothetical protein R2712_06625 [Vicinamibacterales bacterium]